MLLWKYVFRILAAREAMAEGPSEGIKVPAGFCVKGCGKPVAPGLTKNGNPYKTCCRGNSIRYSNDFKASYGGFLVLRCSDK